MTKNTDDLLRQTSRTDGATKRGDMTTGDGNAVPSRDPIFISPTLGQTGDMVSGSPLNDQTATPDLPAIEKLTDTRSVIPGPARQL